MKEIFKIFGIEWCLVIVAIFFIDASVAMFAVMFIGPIAVVVFFIINFLIKKFTEKAIVQKIFRIISITLAMAISIFIINYGIRQYSPNKVFESIIANPIPESVKNIERSGRLNALGSSSFYMTFDINPTDFETIIKSENFSKFHQNNVKNPTGRAPKLYKQTLSEAGKYMGDISEIYIFEHTNSGYRFDALVVNREHTRVFYNSK